MRLLEILNMTAGELVMHHDIHQLDLCLCRKDFFKLALEIESEFALERKTGTNLQTFVPYTKHGPAWPIVIRLNGAKITVNVREDAEKIEEETRAPRN